MYASNVNKETEKQTKDLEVDIFFTFQFFLSLLVYYLSEGFKAHLESLWM